MARHRGGPFFCYRGQTVIISFVTTPCYPHGVGAITLYGGACNPAGPFSGWSTSAERVNAMIATRSASPSIDRALECAAAGWYVFPASKSKTPRLRAEFTFDFRPVLAPWADPFIVDNGAGRFRMEEGKAGSYLGSRDDRTIRAAFAASSVSNPCLVGIMSDRLVIDVDAPDLVPAEIQPHLDELPHCTTPGGGMHYFARGGSHYKCGAFRAPDGEKIGDLKHLRVSYSIAYPGLPAYDECDVQTDPRVYAWLDDCRKVSAPAAGRSRRAVGGYADLRPSSYTDGDAPQPADMADTGRHDVMRDGTMADAARGVDRRGEWVQALSDAGRDPRVAAQEVDRAYAGAVAKVAETDDLRARLDAAESRARAAEAKVAELAQTKPVTALDAFEEMCARVGVRFSESRPGGIHFATWHDEERQKIGRVTYDRLRVALMDENDSDKYTKRNNDLSALVHRACSVHPFDSVIEVSSTWDALEGVMRAVPPGRYRMAHWIERAGALLRNQTGVEANKGELAPEARRVASHLGMTALPATSRYNVPAAGGGWETHPGSDQHRVWGTPPDWTEEGSHLRGVGNGAA